MGPGERFSQGALRTLCPQTLPSETQAETAGVQIRFIGT